ncbi:MAG: hypothetical protein HQM10_18490 [Candidatus Riflebacteria bacterium]|nr:hypothetical protein [Candidatus Riflebacteria bacterium]
MTLHILMLVSMFIAVIWTVLAPTLIGSALGLGITSSILTIIMFQFNAPLAAVFELSICTGLISVVFISTIGLSNPLSYTEMVKRKMNRFKRFIFLPLIILLIEIYFINNRLPFDFKPATVVSNHDVSTIFWNVRHLDIVGQIFLLFVGVIGVIVFFKEKERK